MSSATDVNVHVVAATQEIAMQIGAIIPQDLRLLRLDGTSWQLTRGLSTRSPAIPASTHQSLLHRAKQALIELGPTRFAVLLSGIRTERQRARHILQQLKASSLVVFDDRAIRPEMVWLNEARRLTVGRVLVAFAASSIESDLFARRKKSKFRTGRIRARLWNKLLPAAIRSDASGIYLFHDGWSLLAALLSGLSIGKPWVPAGGDIDHAAFHGAADIVEPLTEGVPPGRLMVTGQASLDRVAKLRQDRQRVRSEIMRRYGLDEARPLLVCAVPHTAEHGFAQWEQHNEHTRSLFKAIAASDCSSLLSLHPRSRKENYRKLADEFGLAIAETPLVELLPAADIFAAGFSSTVRWAAAMGIPTVISDLPGFGYKIYDCWPQIRVGTNEASLGEALIALSGNAALRESVGNALAESAQDSLLLDGRACERIAELILSSSMSRSKQ